MPRLSRSDQVSKELAELGIPLRPFFYTLEQIADMIAVNMKVLEAAYIYYDRRTPGIHKKDMLKAHNLAPIGEPPAWRVVDTELIRWFKFQGFRVYERGWIQPNKAL